MGEIPCWLQSGFWQKHISQFRFILGDNNTVVVDGITYPLKAPSGQQSGFKVNVDETLTEGVKYEVWTDFDVQKSIVVPVRISICSNL